MYVHYVSLYMYVVKVHGLSILKYIIYPGMIRLGVCLMINCVL